MPTCVVDPAFSSIDCRLAELPSQIVVSPDYPKFEQKLQNLIGKANELVAAAQTNADQGRTSRAKKGLGKANARLKNFVKAVESKKGEKAIEEQLRETLADEAEGVRTDVILLRESL